MSKSALSYADVASAASTLHGAGSKNPGAREIRELLIRQRGTHAPIGSMTSIQRHLQRWRDEERPREAVLPAPQLPAPVCEALFSWANGAAAKVESALQAQLDAIRNELNVAVEEGAHLEERMDASLREVEARTCERDRVLGELSALRNETDGVKAELLVSREHAANYSRQLASAQAESRALESHLNETRAEVARLRAASQAGIESKQVELEAANDERNEAREARAAAVAALEGEVRRAQQAEARETALRLENQQLNAQITKLVVDLDEVKGRLFKSQLHITTLEAELNAFKLLPIKSKRSATAPAQGRQCRSVSPTVPAINGEQDALPLGKATASLV